MRCTVKPAPFSVFSRNVSAPLSAGVTDGQRSKSRAMATGSADTGMAPLGPQQFVDAGFGTGAFIDTLDNNSTIQAGAAALSGQRAGHNHGIGRYFALRDLSALAVNDAGRSAKINAHRQ